MKRIYTPIKHKRILIVDDDQVVASTYQGKLQRERFEVEVSCDSRHVLRMLELEPFDLVILDLSAPEMCGEQVLNALRSPPGPEPIPVIVFLNPYLSNQVNAVREAKATRHVTKSDCTPDQMMAMVREVLAISPSSTAGDHEADGARSAQSKTEFQTQLAAAFFYNATQRIRELRAGYHAFVNAEQKEQRLSCLFEIYRQTRLLAGAAGVSGLRKIARLTTALEALLLQLHGKPARITSSVIRTIAQAVDLLACLFADTAAAELDVSVRPAILVADDEVISREAICSALEKAGLAAVSVEDPMVAEGLLEQTHFDLIFLDVEMPGQSGLDLCGKIRKMTTNRATPVVFVTAHSDFESRAQSVLSGGNDFIAKPFLSSELAVKALTWLFRGEAGTLSTAIHKKIDQSQQTDAAPLQLQRACVNGKDKTLAVPVGKS
jgi:CheY-like chemotaxis protein